MIAILHCVGPPSPRFQRYFSIEIWGECSLSPKFSVPGRRLGRITPEMIKPLLLYRSLSEYKLISLDSMNRYIVDINGNGEQKYAKSWLMTANNSEWQFEWFWWQSKWCLEIQPHAAIITKAGRRLVAVSAMLGCGFSCQYSSPDDTMLPLPDSVGSLAFGMVMQVWTDTTPYQHAAGLSRNTFPFHTSRLLSSFIDLLVPAMACV